jgi:hypothetical protein
MKAAIALAVSARIASGGHAVANGTVPLNDPANSTATVPVVVYRATVPQPVREPAVGDWKAANDAVARIGGWRAYAAESRPPATPAASTESHPHHGERMAPAVSSATHTHDDTRSDAGMKPTAPPAASSRSGR